MLTLSCRPCTIFQPLVTARVIPAATTSRGQLRTRGPNWANSLRKLSTIPPMTQQSKQPKHLLTMIPGPIEFDDQVLDAMSHPSVAHTAQPFVDTFSATLKQLRQLFFASSPEAQPFVIAGGGMLGWELSAANFVQKGDNVLVLSTGFFSDSWAKAIEVYGANVTVQKAEVGGVSDPALVEQALKETKYKAITITQVDTSTAVLQPVKELAALVKKVSPETLIFVDGVCSIGVEEFRFDDWGIDYVLTAPQKAIGAPAGLSISVASGRALASLKDSAPVGYFIDLRRWLPVMQAYESGKPAYFSTPAIQNIYSLHESLSQIAPNEEALYARFKTHAEASNKFKDALNSVGIKLIAKNRDVAAHGLTAAYLPENVALPDLTKYMLNKNFVIAGGILPPIQTKYFRVGHMGVSVTKYGHLDAISKELPIAIKSLEKGE